MVIIYFMQDHGKELHLATEFLKAMVIVAKIVLNLVKNSELSIVTHASIKSVDCHPFQFVWNYPH